MDRRAFISTVAATSLAGKLNAAPKPSLTRQADTTASQQAKNSTVVVGPPVVQNPTSDGFNISWQVSSLATGHVQWGITEKLGQISKSDHHGLAQFDDQILNAKIVGTAGASEIFYRLVTVPVTYKNAYQIVKLPQIYSQVRRLKLPNSKAKSMSLGIVNDTHEHEKTISLLSQRIAHQDPDLLLWNGDISNNFKNPKRLPHICLSPGGTQQNHTSGGWASTRGLLFVPGNHDVRGRYAMSLAKALTPWDMQAGDDKALSNLAWHGGRYCFALRHGPVAMIGLDTGEDKPDNRKAFAGLAAFEPYRRAQERWLINALKTDEIASAPYLIAFSHIPLRGLPGQNDGQSKSGYAYYSGHGQSLWLNHLIQAKCSFIVSGHTHRFRADLPTEKFPIHQFVGGGPKLHQATYLSLKADATKMHFIAEDLQQKELGKWDFKPRH